MVEPGSVEGGGGPPPPAPPPPVVIIPPRLPPPPPRVLPPPGLIGPPAPGGPPLTQGVGALPIPFSLLKKHRPAAKVEAEPSSVEGGGGGGGGEHEAQVWPGQDLEDAADDPDSLLDAYPHALKSRLFMEQVLAACDYDNVDWLAALAVAWWEGASGGIGDSGSSYGPWQLHIGGALPRKWSKLGRNSAKTNAWAWSANGINYAVGAMAAAGAAGLDGRAAVHAIVYDFERPAKPAPEASGCEAHRALMRGAGDQEHVIEHYADDYKGPAGQQAEGGGGAAGPPPDPVEGANLRGWGDFKSSWHDLMLTYGRDRQRHTAVIAKIGGRLLDELR